MQRRTLLSAGAALAGTALNLAAWADDDKKKTSKDKDKPKS